jgi:hypothetical protein
MTKCTARDEMFGAVGCLARDGMLGARRDVRRWNARRATGRLEGWRVTVCLTHDQYTARDVMFDTMGCSPRDGMLGARRDVRRVTESSARDWRFAAELWYALGQCRCCKISAPD